MKKLLTITVLFTVVFTLTAYSQQPITGKILNARTNEPVEFAVVSIPELGLWATSDKKGDFILRSVSSGKITIEISCLGFAKNILKISNFSELPADRVYLLKEDNLALSEVTVTAQRKSDAISTTYSIDRNAINHVQVIGVTDILSQLPGAQSRQASSLTSEQRIALRSQSTNEMDNPTFGTAIEVDGVRLSNNGAFVSENLSGIEGIGTRNIAVSNIESIEIVTGLPSVEHGDLTSGIVKINTRKGKSLYELEMTTKPLIKSYSLNKGFDLGMNAGTLNAGIEHVQSIADRASPYTKYVRNNFSLTYKNTFGQKSKPLEFTFGLTGNLGGYNSTSDPDAFTETYSKLNDNLFRSNLHINWLLNKKWITNLEFTGSALLNDKLQEVKTNKSSSSATASIHTTEEGYFIATKYEPGKTAPITLIPAGYWYQVMFNDEKPVSLTSELKARWIKKIGKFRSEFKMGGEYVYSGNYGRGVYYDNMLYAPTFREFRFDKQPFVNNISAYTEEKIILPVLKKELQLQAGIREDIIFIKGSEYGVAQSLSPRINAQYTLIDDKQGWVKKLNFHCGWGDAVKLPSSTILFPRPSYSDKISFAPGTLADGTVYYAYYTLPVKQLYNPDLKWQRNRKKEIGMEMTLGKTRISVTAFQDKTTNPYKTTEAYSPFTFKLTTQTSLDNCNIPVLKRMYNIDKTTGIVTVSDITGQLSSQRLSYLLRKTFKSNTYYTNGSPVEKKGIEWVVDFGQIQKIKTSVKIDGSYFYYKGVDQTIIKDLASATNMGDGNPYKYISYYVGTTGNSNGNITKKLNANIVFTTHIPAIRMIFTFRIDNCLYDYAQNLSEYSGGNRSFVIKNKDDLFPTNPGSDIYAGNQYVAMYPLYYTSLDDMNTLIPFAEKFYWARDNDKALYNELAKMIVRTNYNYIFNVNKISGYFSGNISLTKEIGDKISVTFQANNFFNNLGQITESKTGNKRSLYDSGKIPSLYYGLSARLKF